uniref:ORF83b n=1 Tax=Pinus thunbergii TaxID=3350 RepID=Q32977_PINTH|nr:ORF83b [Pinus thunbergii]BAA04414.1 ORF83b [Pinus thunbergii]
MMTIFSRYSFIYMDKAHNCWVGISSSLCNARSFNSFFVRIIIELDFPSLPNLLFFQYEPFSIIIHVTNEQLFNLFPIYSNFKE